MHLDVHDTSPGSHASMQRIMAACTGSVVVAGGALSVVAVVVWAVAKTAKAEARRIEVARILGGDYDITSSKCKKSNQVSKQASNECFGECASIPQKHRRGW